MEFSGCDLSTTNNRTKHFYIKMKKEKEGLSSQLSSASSKSRKKMRPRGSMPSAWFTLPTDLQAMEVRVD
jgi:hypothetical protein